MSGFTKVAKRLIVIISVHQQNSSFGWKLWEAGFFGHRLKFFWNDWTKLVQFSQCPKW